MQTLDRGVSLPFANRQEAGRLLAERLRQLGFERPLVLGIPRGGVPLAAAVAEALGAPLDIIVARKLGAPLSPELAIGAVTSDGGRFLNEDIVAQLAVDEWYLEQETARQLTEAARREQSLRGGRPVEDVRGRLVILCDDGLATGATMRAAVRSLRTRGAGRIVVAVPVGSHEACEALASEADQVVCLEQPEPFGAVGRFYLDFSPVEDAEVARILAQRGNRP